MKKAVLLAVGVLGLSAAGAVYAYDAVTHTEDYVCVAVNTQSSSQSHEAVSSRADGYFTCKIER